MAEPVAEDELRLKVMRRLLETGYPLEMRVAMEARRLRPLYVHQSRHYADPITDKIRETDVVACWMASKVAMDYRYVYLVIECKSKPAPWVVFDDGEGLTDDPQARLEWAVTRDFPEVDAPVELRKFPRLNQTLFKPSRVGTGVVEVQFKDDKAERNPAWEAVQAAVSATHGFMRDIQSDDPMGGGTWRSVGIAVFPVVVTSGSLFRAYLDWVEDVTVERIDRGEVLVRHSVEPRQTRCLIVTEAALPALISEAAASVDALLG